MININKEKLVVQSVLGKISHPVMLTRAPFGVLDNFATTWDGKPKIAIGNGGIRYNVKVGDSCFGWIDTECIEPGVTLVGVDHKSGEMISQRGSSTEMAFHKMCCVGNEVSVVEGEAKGSKGVVVGKTGYAIDPSNVLVQFADDVLDNLIIGEKMSVKSQGFGLKVEGFDGQILNSSPDFLESLNLKFNENKLIFPIVKKIPPHAMGMGSGGDPGQSGHYCIQTNPPHLVSELGLSDLKIGDLVLCEDILMTFGKGYFKGAKSVCVIASGSSDLSGQGVRVYAIASSQTGMIEGSISPNSNLVTYLDIP
jgi:hypothetical protein